MKIFRPEIKLTIEPKADISNAKWFVANGEFVTWFLPPDLQFILSKKFTQKERDKILSAYTSHQHLIHKKEIRNGVANIRIRWHRMEDDYFHLIDRLFNGHPWPKGKYTGFVSVYYMFPRNIRDKTFYFSYRENHHFNPVKTIGHELLHFMFFDYIDRHYHLNETSRVKGRPDAYIWRVSETFNNVIEHWKPYRSLFQTKKPSKPYPGCEKMFTVMTKQWRSKPDIKTLLDHWLK